jgi:hypothetical protein
MVTDWEARAVAAEADRDRLQAELDHLKSEFNYESWRGDHLVYAREWDAFNAWQRDRQCAYCFDHGGDLVPVHRGCVQEHSEAQTLRDALAEAVDALTEMLQHPDHVSDEVRKERNRHALALIERARAATDTTPAPTDQERE